MSKETSSRAKSAMGGHGSKKSGKHPHEVHVRRGHSGGFVVRHSHKPDADTGEMPPEEEHVVPDMASLQDHMQSAMGDQPPAPAAPAPDPAAAGAPPAAAPPGM